jgi:hypothetical protein
MGDPLEHEQRSERQRGQVLAAIMLVAEGRFPRVGLVNIPDARSIARDLAPRAAALGVAVDVRVEVVGAAPALLVRRR